MHALMLLAAALADLSVSPATLPACAPGWRIELVAQAPALRHPTVIACAPDGRVFVAEDPMDISAPADQPLGRILCFHPDGRSSVFAEGLYAVFGMAYLEGRLYVLHNPKLTRFVDADGIGREREDLIEQTNPKPWALDWNDHVPANFKLALDGYFYAAVGDKGVYGAVGRDGKRVDLRGGGVLRLRPDATELEIYSRGTRNILDVAINAEDDLFTYDNTDEHQWMSRLTQMVEEGFYGYPWDFQPRRPYTLWTMADYGPGAATNVWCYEEDALPADHRGDLFLADFGKRAVLRVRIEREGASYRALEKSDFVWSGGPDDDFRPVGLALAPDGRSFYVSDWNHPDTKSSAVAGRLFRVSFSGESRARPQPAWAIPAAMGKPFEAPLEELIAALSHPARALRLTAQRRLADRGAAALAPLAALLADRSAAPRARWHAIWALDAIDGGAAARAAILAAARDAEASVRRQALRQLGTRRAREARALFIELLRDSEASVRFQAATALGRLGDAAAVPALLAALEEADGTARYAAFTALNRIGRADAAAWPAIASGLRSSSAAVREGALFAMRETFDAAVVFQLADFARDAAGDGAARAAAVDVLAGLYLMDPPWRGDWWSQPYHPALSPRPPRTERWEGTAAVAPAARAALGDADSRVRRAAIEAIRAMRESDAVPLLVRRFAVETDLELRSALLGAFGALRVGGARDAIARTLFGDRDEDPQVLLDAVRAAEAFGKDAAPLLKRFAALPMGASPARLEAIAALGRLGGPEVFEALAARLDDAEAAARQAAAAALGQLGDRRAVAPLLEAFTGDSTRREAAAALARMPDPRALEAYLFGIADPEAALRSSCSAAIASFALSALPAIEARLASGMLDDASVRELRRIYLRPRPLSGWRALEAPLECAAALDGAIEGIADPRRLEAALAERCGAGARWVDAGIAGDGRIVLERRPAAGATAGVVVAAAALDAGGDCAVHLLAGSGDDAALWLNGRKLHEHRGARQWRLDADRVPARLAGGANLIVLRVRARGSGDPGAFSVHVAGPSEGPLFEAPIEAPPPERYLDYAIEHPGDPQRGRVLFADPRGLACGRCHRVFGDGGEVGPDLSAAGTQFSRKELIESVLFPSQKVREGYQQTVVVLKSGQVVAGILKSETGEALDLVDAEAKPRTVLKAEIASRSASSASLMPEGLHAGLSMEELADLAAYLESLRGRP